MRFLVPQPELLALLPSAATAAHCRRVAALAMEVGGAVGPALRSLVLLEQAALLHHTSPVVLNPPATGRLLHDVFPAGLPAPVLSGMSRCRRSWRRCWLTFAHFRPAERIRRSAPWRTSWW
jgi:hypothetical protein